MVASSSAAPDLVVALIAVTMPMTDEVPEPNPPLSAEEESAVARLTPGDITFIDTAILSCASPRWQKVAMVAIRAIEKLKPGYPDFSPAFYARRVQILADQGKLESQGDLNYMRFSEVRLRTPDSPPGRRR